MNPRVVRTIRDSDGLGGEQLRDTDVFVEGIDETMPRPDRVKRERQRTLAGSQTDFTKGDPSTQTIANAEISGDSAITVMFGIQPTGNFDEATGFGLPRAYAQIQWLVNGVPTTRLVSVFSGQQVTGVGEAVSIQAWDATDAVDGDPSPTYPLTCILAPGTRGSNASPPTYWPNPSNFSLEPGDTADIPIPQNVGMKSFQVLTGIEADTDVNTIIGTDIGTLFDVGQAAFSKFCPFNDPRITAVRITNTGMVNIAVGIVFGVDG